MLILVAILVLVASLAVGYLSRKKESRSKPLRPQSTPRTFLVVPDKSNLTSYIEKAEQMSSDGQVNISVVRTQSGISLLTDYERKVRSAEALEVLFETDTGFPFPQRKAA